MPAPEAAGKVGELVASTSSPARIRICSTDTARRRRIGAKPRARLTDHPQRSARPCSILVANLGSTSFKFKLLDMDAGGAEVASGGYERIGQNGRPIRTHGDVIDAILKSLPHPPDAIGFKAVHGGPISGAVRVTTK